MSRGVNLYVLFDNIHSAWQDLFGSIVAVRGWLSQVGRRPRLWRCHVIWRGSGMPMYAHVVFDLEDVSSWLRVQITVLLCIQSHHSQAPKISSGSSTRLEGHLLLH
jgi:hypothetical protein